MQPYTVAEDYIESAGILLSIGNDKSPMAPSKIYEYMATGKPIIHFYTWENDSCIEPLNKYGNALLISRDDKLIESRLLAFINEAGRLPYKKVAQIFRRATPEYTVNLITEEKE